MRFLLVITCLFATACVHIPTLSERRYQAEELAVQHGWHAVTLRAGAFDLVTYLPTASTRSELLTVYIEGDGFAWVEGSLPSDDPTPRQTLVLQLALAQPDGESAYLARPCQYIDAEKSGCSKRYWTNMRFAPEVIAATHNALDQLKQRFGATRLILVGYSGGGTVAALTAAKRNDVVRLITVAGNLDHKAWTDFHHMPPLVGSLNPANEISALQSLSQLHFVGSRDRNTTPELVLGFAQQFPEDKRPAVMIEPEYDHQCCWVNNWPALWRKTMHTQSTRQDGF